MIPDMPSKRLFTEGGKNIEGNQKFPLDCPQYLNYYT